MVNTAHSNGMRVILDIIRNHTGNVFGYDPDRYVTTGQDGRQLLDPRWDDAPYAVGGFNDRLGRGTVPFVRTDPSRPAAFPAPDDAVWPVEFQDPDAFTRRGTSATSISIRSSARATSST